MLPPDDLTEDLLSAYLDGELSGSELAAVEARLEDSGEWRAILADVRAAREAVRGLPNVDAPAGCWDRIIAAVEAADAPALTLVPDLDIVPPAPVVTELDAARVRRTPRRSRWVTALAGAAAAAVVAAVLVVPSVNRVKPPVGAFSDAHAMRSSTSDDSVSSLAPVGMLAGFTP